MCKFININQNQGEHQVILNTGDISNIVRQGKLIYISFLSDNEYIALKITDGEEKQVMMDLARLMRE